MIPPSGFVDSKNAYLTASMLDESLIDLRNLSFVSFEGFNFDTGRHTAIQTNAVSRVLIQDCVIKNFSGAGINIEGKDNRIDSCRIYNIGSSAVSLKGGDPDTLEPGNNVIENCEISKWSCLNRVYTGAVNVRGVGNRVSHCLMYDAPHGAMTVGGNDHLIEYNDIHHVLQEFEDFGIIYFNLGGRPFARGTVVRHNYFHDIAQVGHRIHGVYLDNGTMGVTVEGNIFQYYGNEEHTHMSPVFGNSCAHVTVRNNMFLDCRKTFTCSYMFLTWAKDSYIRYMPKWKSWFAEHPVDKYPHYERYPELKIFFNEDRAVVDTNRFERNLVYNPNMEIAIEGPCDTLGAPEDKGMLTQLDNNWVAQSDPGFVDYANGDLELKKDAALFNQIPGFQPIPFHEIGLIKDKSRRNMQRTMRSLEGSTKENPAHVRILYYGQSITAQNWRGAVNKYLRNKYPTAILDLETRPIGGFQAPALIRTAEHDLYPYYPDLLIFHVYGGEGGEFEAIIRNMRERTTAEILLWTDHVSKKNYDEHSEMIRKLAKKYDCHLVDVRKKWKVHLEETGEGYSAYLRDVIHLNKRGEALLGSFMVDAFKEISSGEIDNSSGSISEVSFVKNETQEYDFHFEGNRLTAVLAEDLSSALEVEVYIDGQSIADIPGSIVFSRPSNGPQHWMPAIMQISSEAPLLEEVWTLTCLPDSEEDGSRVHFKVEGSVTGMDGEGWSDQAFISKSKRVVISPKDWKLAWELKHKKLTLPEGFQIAWNAVPLFIKTLKTGRRGEEFVLAQGMRDGKHELKLKFKGDSSVKIKSFKAYKP
jgi:hypothetical protein